MQNPPKHVRISSGPAPLFDSTPTSPASLELLTIPEAAALLRISISGVRRLQQHRRVPFIKVGGSVRFLESDLREYVTKQRIGPVDQ